MTDETTYVKLAELAELAAKWRVSKPTARNRTRSPGFPAPLVLGPRTLRWPLEEAPEWKQRERQARARVVTKTHPRLRSGTTRPPAKVRTVIREVA